MKPMTNNFTSLHINVGCITEGFQQKKIKKFGPKFQLNSAEKNWSQDLPAGY